MLPLGVAKLSVRHERLRGLHGEGDKIGLERGLLQQVVMEQSAL